jgi:integrase
MTFEPGYPTLGLADARDAANKAKLAIQAGVDPGAAKAEAKAVAARAPDTIANVVEVFIRRDLEGKKRAPRYIAETRRIFDNHVLPRWADRDIATITRRDVIELLDAVMDSGSVRKDDGKRRKLPGGPIIANRVLAAIRAMFNWALRRGIIESTPAALVERPGEETRRDRTLRAEEILALWPRFAALEYPFGPFFQMALATGQRREEVARMRWADVDLGAQLWILPAEATKAARGHAVPLSPLAIALLEGLPKLGTYVFTTTRDRPISGFSKAKARLDAMRTSDGANADTVAPWTIHDLRRTAATEMGRLGVSRFIIGKVLNHADRSVTGIYDRHQYLKEKREALAVWGEYLDRLTRPPGAVVQLQVARA